MTIHKFVCADTVELRIQALQQKKLDLADGVLTGAKRASKLTMDDLKMLFGLEQKPLMSGAGAGIGRHHQQQQRWISPNAAATQNDAFKYRPGT